ncbi:MAG TPA: response regulator, partial [Noviherbaspirillum sp.]|nr:response regulator [Noviherbaspirillum sp.]
MTAELIRDTLRDQADIAFHYEPDASQTLARCRELQPTVVLVDLKMPGIGGMEVLQQVRTCAATRLLPLILLSSEDAPEIKAEAFARGAHDYLVKWPAKRELVARLRYHSAAYWAHRERDEA